MNLFLFCSVTQEELREVALVQVLLFILPGVNMEQQRRKLIQLENVIRIIGETIENDLEFQEWVSTCFTAQVANFFIFYFFPLTSCALLPLTSAIDRLACCNDFNLDCLNEVVENVFQRGITWEMNVVLIYLPLSLQARVRSRTGAAGPHSSESCSITQPINLKLAQVHFVLHVPPTTRPWQSNAKGNLETRVLAGLMLNKVSEDYCVFVCAPQSMMDVPRRMVEDSTNLLRWILDHDKWVRWTHISPSLFNCYFRVAQPLISPLIPPSYRYRYLQSATDKTAALTSTFFLLSHLSSFFFFWSSTGH